LSLHYAAKKVMLQVLCYINIVNIQKFISQWITHQFAWSFFCLVC